MGACCGSRADEDADKKFEKGGAQDFSTGPVKQRHCTDIICLLLLIINLGAYFLVTFIYAKTGSVQKLWQPRDYAGNFCGVKQNWNNGPNFDSSASQTWMMNVTATTSVVMKQLMCSTYTANLLVYNSNPVLSNSADQNQYLCACCLMPCASCTSSGYNGGDLTSLSGVSSTINSRIADFTNMANVADLFSPAGANGDFFTNIWASATQYFVGVCAASCTLDSSLLTSASARTYTYKPAADDPLRVAWNAVLTSSNIPASFTLMMTTNFTFAAYPTSVCNYDARYCVPVPGLQPNNQGYGYCDFNLGSSVKNSLGSAASNAYSALGGNAIKTSGEQYFGQWVGDFVRTIDTYAVVAAVAFVTGLVFMIMLRFTVGFCVYIALLLGLALFIFVGAGCFIRSGQCANQSFSSSASSQLSAVTVATQSSVVNGQIYSESLSGDGSTYVGVQYKTISGRTCQAWGTSSPQAAARLYNSTNYPNSNLKSNFCRNPYKASDVNRAATIWCFTTDTDMVWEQCAPIGVIQPVCQNGYIVTSASMRSTLKIISYIIWACGGLYLLAVLCLMSQIRLAIALNKVAAMFVAHNPLILLIPIVQSLIALVWVGAWAASAAFLLSEVPDNYIPTSSFSTYAAAGGTDTSTGACTSMWPSGSVYKDEAGCDSQIYGQASCWKCSPPRYIFDVRFCYSLFSFFWNNEFFIAFAQMALAGSVGVWFFTPNEEKGRVGVIRQAIWNTFRYHLGTLAFGALLIAIVKTIQYIIYYFQKQAEAHRNRIVVCILKCTQCILWCFEKCLKFINKNAYIQTALLGTPFCTSAKNAFFLIVRNALRFGTVASLSWIIHFIGYCFITAGTSAAGYFILQAMHPDVSPVIPVVIYVFSSYMVAGLYMNVFGMAVDTSLQCVIAAEEMGCNDGSFVPGPLVGILAHQPSPGSAA